MKEILISILLILNLSANEDSIFGFSKSDMNQLWDKTKEISKDALVKTKEYSIKAKNRVVEQTVLNGLNALVDTKNIKVLALKIDDETNKIDVELFLKGEYKNLLLNIDDFRWDTTKDKQSIVFENLNIKSNISWIQSVIDEIKQRDDGFITIHNSKTIFALLFSIKPNEDIKYIRKDKQPFDIIHHNYDTRYIKIEKFEVNNNKIYGTVKLSDDTNGCVIDVPHYNLLTGNNKTVIVLKDMDIRSFCRPWVESIIKLQNNEIDLDYTPKLYNLLNKGNEI